jgi:hypothetical protein
MTATLPINGKLVMIDDASLAEINKALEKIPLMAESWQGDERVYKAIPGKSLRIVPEFSLKSCQMDTVK